MLSSIHSTKEFNAQLTFTVKIVPSHLRINLPLTNERADTDPSFYRYLFSDVNNHITRYMQSIGLENVTSNIQLPEAQ